MVPNAANSKVVSFIFTTTLYISKLLCCNYNCIVTALKPAATKRKAKGAMFFHPENSLKRLKKTNKGKKVYDYSQYEMPSWTLFFVDYLFFIHQFLILSLTKTQ